MNSLQIVSNTNLKKKPRSCCRFILKPRLATSHVWWSIEVGGTVLNLKALLNH